MESDCRDHFVSFKRRLVNREYTNRFYVAKMPIHIYKGDFEREWSIKFSFEKDSFQPSTNLYMTREIKTVKDAEGKKKIKKKKNCSNSSYKFSLFSHPIQIWKRISFYPIMRPHLLTVSMGKAFLRDIVIACCRPLPFSKI